MHLPVHLCGEHDVLAYDLHRAGEIHLALGDRRFRLSRRPVEELVEPPVGHAQPAAVIEVPLVEPERAVVESVEQMGVNPVHVPRLPERREPHQLVLSAVHLESRLVRERRVQEAERIGEAKLLE